MKRILSGLLAIVFIQMNAQNKAFDEQTLFTVNKEKVTVNEFMSVYNKNRNIGEDIDPKTPREYLDLYINFKLKVQNAKELGMDTMPRFINEFNTYRSQLAEPYLSDKAVNRELVTEAYNRAKYDIRASHIMMAVPPEAETIDTVKAFKKIKRLKERIEAGESFETIAKEYSQDTYSAKNGGDLGFFTVFNMVYPFESAAYTTEIGEMSDVVRSQFGYHLIKVTDSRPARGTVKVAHILLIDNEQTPELKKLNSKQKIDEIYKEIQEGADFETMAKQYSEDKSSAYAGGLIPEFGINKMFPEFEEVAFSLEVGEVSQPFKTPVGWHLVKVLEKPESKSLEESEKELKKKIERDSRSQQGRISIIKRLKKDFNFKEYPKNIKLAFSQVDKGYLDMQYDSDGHKYGDKRLFSFEDKEYTVTDFLDWLELNQAKGGKKLGKLNRELEKAYKRFSEGKILAYEKAHLEEKYPEFAMLSREYFEGILLFDLTEKKVWRKSVSDTSGLETFFQANQSKYQWEKRYDLVLVSAATEKIAKKAQKMLKKGKSLAELNEKLNESSLLNLKTDTGTFEVKDKDVLAMLSLPESGVSERIEKDGRYVFAFVKSTTPAGNKTLTEARGMVLSDYTAYLEQEWLKELKAKYEVKVDQGLMNKVEKALE
jgi:peptidyl-prolyl cis-trans isomerase SurA